MQELVHDEREGEDVRLVVVPLPSEHLRGHVQVAARLSGQVKLLGVVKCLGVECSVNSMSVGDGGVSYLDRLVDTGSRNPAQESR